MIGTTISHYQIQKKIGAGGMGEVYLAYDPNLDRRVALKILPAEFTDNPERLARFIREAKAASAISHPNVAHIYEIGTENEIHFIAMEFIEGESLASRMNRHPITFEEILNIARQVIGALQEAHRKKVIHRDIKPANIMMTSTGHVKLVDFGLAKFQRDETVSSHLTTASRTELGVVMGTLPYMSPEQLLGHPVDHRTDFFSLGVVLYQLATAKLPFQGNTGPEIADAILHTDPGSVHDLNRHVPADLSKTITRMLSKKAVERQSNADEILSDLERVIRRTTNVGSFWSAFRKPSVALPAVVLLLAILAGSFWQFHRNSRIRWAREEALLQITQLMDKGEYASAVNVGLEAEKYIPNDPLLKTLWTGMSSTISIQTEPPGADVLLRDYNSPEQDWKLAGKSPISKMRMPKGHLRMEITKPG